MKLDLGNNFELPAGQEMGCVLGGLPLIHIHFYLCHILRPIPASIYLRVGSNLKHFGSGLERVGSGHVKLFIYIHNLMFLCMDSIIFHKK